jgi:hypothetical protein
MPQDFKPIEHILTVVKSRIEAHQKFKSVYNKQLAFDFSLFQFFSINENNFKSFIL